MVQLVQCYMNFGRSNRCFRSIWKLTRAYSIDCPTKAASSSGSSSSVLHQYNSQYLWDQYKKAKDYMETVPRRHKINPDGVFVNNELNLREVDVYGFDYDYTLAVYKKDLNNLIYELAMQRLIDHYKYPYNLTELDYDPEFAVRGLHYDIDHGILMKLDAFCLIQSGTAYRGKTKLTDVQIEELYDGFYVPSYYLSSGQESKNEVRIKQLVDLFSLPEVGLLSNVAEYFQNNKIEYDADSLFRDVQAAVNAVHMSGDLYTCVNNNFEKYIHPMPGLREYFERLFAAKKIIFIVTNSPFQFINKGLTYLIGPNWRDLFHYVIVQARKPKFFKETNKPFRIYNEETDRLSWGKVTELKRGLIYAEGNLDEFLAKSQVGGHEVLYFGDHVFSDLAPMLKLGWRTGAIVPELRREIQIQSTDFYRVSSDWLVTLTTLIELYEDSANDADMLEVLASWHKERIKLKHELKHMFNPQFGSIFRTFHSPTYFSRRMMRLADIYTARLPNLLDISLNHTFYPRRTALPHETHVGVPEFIYGNSQKFILRRGS